MIRIKRVDTSVASVAETLNQLQLEILPADALDDVSGGYWWIAYSDGNPVGFCGVKQSSRWFDTGYLCRAGLLPEHTGKGIQKRMIRVRAQLAKKVGWRWLISDTYENPASTNSLTACGFKMYTPSIKHGAHGTCYWRKKL